MDTIGRMTAEPPTRQELGKLLADHPFVQGMTPEHLAALTDLVEMAHFDAGKLIFQEGQPAKRLFLILHGSVDLEVFNLDTDGLVILNVGDGEALGWSWFVPPYRWRFDAKAIKPTDALCFDAAKLLVLFDEHTDLGYDFMKQMAAIVDQRLYATREHLLNAYVSRR